MATQPLLPVAACGRESAQAPDWTARSWAGRQQPTRKMGLRGIQHIRSRDLQHLELFTPRSTESFKIAARQRVLRLTRHQIRANVFWNPFLLARTPVELRRLQAQSTLRDPAAEEGVSVGGILRYAKSNDGKHPHRSSTFRRCRRDTANSKGGKTGAEFHGVCMSAHIVRSRCQATPHVARTTSSVGMISLAASWPPMRSSTLRASSTPPWCQSWRTLVSGGAKLWAAGESS